MSEDPYTNIELAYRCYFRQAEEIINRQGPYEEVKELMEEVRHTLLRDCHEQAKKESIKLDLRTVYNSTIYQTARQVQERARKRLGLEDRLSHAS